MGLAGEDAGYYGICFEVEDGSALAPFSNDIHFAPVAPAILLASNVAMFLFGLATMFYPPLKLIIGSVTTSVAILVGGIALMILPSLIVGNELLILGGVGAAVGVWFFAHRHGQLRGLVDAAKAVVDEPANKA